MKQIISLPFNDDQNWQLSNLVNLISTGMLWWLDRFHGGCTWGWTATYLYESTRFEAKKTIPVTHFANRMEVHYCIDRIADIWLYTWKCFAHFWNSCERYFSLWRPDDDKNQRSKAVRRERTVCSWLNPQLSLFRAGETIQSTVIYQRFTQCNNFVYE